LNFGDEAMNFAQNSLDKLYEKTAEFKNSNETDFQTNDFENYKAKFLEYINNDLDLPMALALTWNIVKNKKLSKNVKYKLLLDFDKIFGLRLSDVGYNFSELEQDYIIEIKDENGLPLWTDDLSILPREVLDKLNQRKQEREIKNWEVADKIRKELEAMGWLVEDLENKKVMLKRK
jgi:cysteinyl-tRNA synthetase